MRTIFMISAVLLLSSLVAAQTPVSNNAQKSYNVNGPASAAANLSSPIDVTALTDTPFTMSIRSAPSASGYPVAVLFDFAKILGNTIIINAYSNMGIQLDIRDKNGDGYSEQVFIDGFQNPASYTMTNPQGNLDVKAAVPACGTIFSTTPCLTGSDYSSFEISSQAIVYAPTAPLQLESTAAVRGTFTNGYKEFNLGFDASGQFNFKDGFSFKFYGVTYTNAYVSANGFVSFGSADTSFPNPAVSTIRGGVPRIMNYYNDLEPQIGNYGTKIYAQQFTDASGVRKVKFVHDHVAEFSNMTGPHGGECVITENGDISVYVHGYQTLPTINTGVGITPGSNYGPLVFGTGLDLSALSGTNVALGAGAQGFELFDHFFMPAINPVDLAGFDPNPGNAVGPGIVFMTDTTLANTMPINSGYVIQ